MSPDELQDLDLDDLLSSIGAAFDRAQLAIADEAEGALRVALGELLDDAVLAYRLVTTW